MGTGDDDDALVLADEHAYAPFFVIGAVVVGIGAVVYTMWFMRAMFGTAESSRAVPEQRVRERQSSVWGAPATKEDVMCRERRAPWCLVAQKAPVLDVESCAKRVAPPQALLERIAVARAFVALEEEEMDDGQRQVLIPEFERFVASSMGLSVSSLSKMAYNRALVDWQQRIYRPKSAASTGFVLLKRDPSPEQIYDILRAVVATVRRASVVTLTTPNETSRWALLDLYEAPDSAPQAAQTLPHASQLIWSRSPVNPTLFL